MGPYSKLLECGANVVALDVPGAWGKGGAQPAAGLWKRLFELAEASSGTLTYPKDANVSLSVLSRVCLRVFLLTRTQ